MQIEIEEAEYTVERQGTMDAAVRKRLIRWAIQLRGVADGVEGVGRELESLGVPHATLYAQTAAERVDDLSRYLESADLSQILYDLRTYAEEHPTIVAAAAFGIGAAAGRVIKAGAEE
ncbi:MAG: hypothetical protein ACRENA_16025 [Vulcanimicrobiaceae bacterium]